MVTIHILGKSSALYMALIDGVFAPALQHIAE
jgi:hypothetical protein